MIPEDIPQRLRLWRTLFIHRWHAPQTIGEQFGHPSIGMRFEHINHRESLAEYVWRYGAFRENDDGTERQDVSDRPSRKYGFQAIIRELLQSLGDDAPTLLSVAVEYAVLKYGNPDLSTGCERINERLLELDQLAHQYPAIQNFAISLRLLHRDMLPFYVQMRYLKKTEAEHYAFGKIPLLVPLHTADNPGQKIVAGKDPFPIEGDPLLILRSTFARNIYNALCWRARSELFEVLDGPTNKNGIWSTAIVDGEYKRVYVSGDDALVQTLRSLNEEKFPWPLHILAAFKTALSTMITAMPMFIVKNFFRDTFAGFVAGRYHQFPITSTISGAFFSTRDTLLGHDERMRDYLLQGGFYSGLVESEVRMDESLDLISGGVRYHKARRISKRLIHLFTRPAWIAESGTRLHQYRRARKKGATGYEAIRAARMVSSDFANIGASRLWRMYAHTVPFLNASIQGFDQLYQICRPEYRRDLSGSRWGSERTHHVKKTLLSGGCLAGMAFCVWLWNVSDSARLEQYLSETEYEKASYLTLYDVADEIDLRIPVPFQIGAAFMKVPEISLDLVTETETLAGGRFTWSLIHGNLAIGWLPAAVKPFWEVMTNTNFFGKPIVPAYMQYWPASKRFFKRSTPLPLVVLGRWFDVSPLHIQTFVQGWTGHLGKLILTGLDEAMWDTREYGEKPFPKFFGYLTGMAGVQAPQARSWSRWSNEFYELSDWARTWGRSGGERHNEALRVNKVAKRVGQYRSSAYRHINAIRENRNQTRFQKEEKIAEIYTEMTNIYKRVLPAMRENYLLWEQRH